MKLIEHLQHSSVSPQIQSQNEENRLQHLFIQLFKLLYYYSNFSFVKSYCTLFSQVSLLFLTAYLSLFFFFLSLSFARFFSLSSIFFLCSPSLLRSLPLFSILSLFSIARKKEITWVEHGVAWVDREAPI